MSKVHDLSQEEAKELYEGLKQLQPQLSRRIRSYGLEHLITADDLIIDTFVKLANSRVRFNRKKGAILPFLATVATNVLMDVLRKRKTELKTEAIDPNIFYGNRWQLQPDPDTRFVVEQHRLSSRLLNDISEKDRIVVAALYDVPEIEPTLTPWGKDVIEKFRHGKKDTGSHDDRARLAKLLRVSRGALAIRIHRLGKKLQP